MSVQKKFLLQFPFSFKLRNRKKRNSVTTKDFNHAYFLLAFYFTLQLVGGTSFSDNSDIIQVPVHVEYSPLVPISLPEFLHRRGVDLDSDLTEAEAEESNFSSQAEANVKPVLDILKIKAEGSASEGNATDAGAKDSNGTALHKDPLRVEEILRQIFGADMEDEDEDDDEAEYYGQVRIRDEKDPMLMDESRAEPAPVTLLTANANRTESLFPLSRMSRSESEIMTQRRNRDQNGNRADRQRPTPNKRNKNGQGQKQGQRQKPDQGQGRLKGKGKRVDLSKYNAYMDAVLSRMNTLIRKKRMDPLRVNLYAGPSKAGNGNKGKQKNKKNGRHGSSSRSHLETVRGQGSVPTEQFNEELQTENEEESHGLNNEEDADDFSVQDVTLDRDVGLQRRTRSFRSNNDTEPKVDDQVSEEPVEAVDKAPVPESDSKSEEGRKTGNKKQKVSGSSKTPDAVAVVKNKGSSKKKVEKENSDSESESQSAESESAERPSPQTKNNNKNKNSPRPTRGILHGLSTLRRDGNVNVIKDGDRARIVRAKFLLGPVALEILPKKSRKGVSREEQSSANPSKPSPSAAATATAPQLRGILEIRLSPRSPTRIRKLRVFPPGNVQVDGENQKNSGLPSAGPGYRKVTPMATARLRQAAVQVVRQVDGRLRPRIN